MYLNFQLKTVSPYRADIQKYKIKAEKKEMKIALKKIYKAIKIGASDVRLTLNEQTISFLKDRGYIIKDSFIAGDAAHHVSW